MRWIKSLAGVPAPAGGAHISVTHYPCQRLRECIFWTTNQARETPLSARTIQLVLCSCRSRQVLAKTPRRILIPASRNVGGIDVVLVFFRLVTREALFGGVGRLRLLGISTLPE